MKKPLLYFMVLSLFSIISLTGCKKDDSGQVKEQQVLGVWKITKYELNGMVEGEPQTESETYGPGNTAEFKAEGVLKVNTDQLYTGTWQLLNNKLITTNSAMLSSPPTGYTFKKLSSTEMVLYLKQSFGGDWAEVTFYLSK